MSNLESKRMIEPIDGTADKSVRATNFFKVSIRQVKSPTRYIRFLLLFKSWKKVVKPNKHIYKYKELNNRVYNFHFTGWASVDSNEEFDNDPAVFKFFID